MDPGRQGKEARIKMTNFVDTADSRETSRELMVAILQVAGGDEDRAESIWENGPNDAEMAEIVKIVTQNGMYETTDFVWGAAGENWAA